MRALRLRLATLATLLLALPPLPAQQNPSWTTPLPPFRIAPNLYYVGSRDLASYLITTPAGNILINSNLTSSPPLIFHSIEQLGFHPSDIKILLISHAHSDHAGGSAEILKQTHAATWSWTPTPPASKPAAAPTSPTAKPFPAAHVDRILHDGEPSARQHHADRAQDRRPHAAAAPPGPCRSLPGEPAPQLRNVVIVGSWNATPRYRLVATKDQPASYPGIANDFAHTFAALNALPCDIFLGSHGITSTCSRSSRACRSRPLRLHRSPRLPPRHRPRPRRVRSRLSPPTSRPRNTFQAPA